MADDGTIEGDNTRIPVIDVAAMLVTTLPAAFGVTAVATKPPAAT